MKLEQLDYVLPPGRIAQEPARPRDAARLLIVERDGGDFRELRFRELPEHLGPADVLVVNDTRVAPLKLRGVKTTGGRAEALLIERLAEGRWRALVRVRGRLRKGLVLRFGEYGARIEDVGPDGVCVLRLDRRDARSDAAVLEQIGEAPLPPYIERTHARKEDLDDYQSVFARTGRSVAAPTASLHFTQELAAQLQIVPVTLHVGPGTFRPIRAANLEEHSMEAEHFTVPEATAHAIASARDRGGRVICVGTTTVRALETSGGKAGAGISELFIHPGYEFQVADALITNFHLPRSSLLALTMAFGGVERVRAAYAHAISAGFRFYSYGDAMWIR